QRKQATWSGRSTGFPAWSKRSTTALPTTVPWMASSESGSTERNVAIMLFLPWCSRPPRLAYTAMFIPKAAHSEHSCRSKPLSAHHSSSVCAMLERCCTHSSLRSTAPAAQPHPPCPIPVLSPLFRSQTTLVVAPSPPLILPASPLLTFLQPRILHHPVCPKGMASGVGTSADDGFRLGEAWTRAEPASNGCDEGASLAPRCCSA
ncbi:hypothetical protein T484DRAFT_3627328, partial [Baffinella frigidus]